MALNTINDPEMNWELLAEAIRRRRGQLQLTQAAAPAASNGQISVSPWSGLERAAVTRISQRSLAAVDAVLRWKPGTAELVLRSDSTASFEDLADLYPLFDQDEPDTRRDEAQAEFEALATSASGALDVDDLELVSALLTRMLGMTR